MSRATPAKAADIEDFRLFATNPPEPATFAQYVLSQSAKTEELTERARQLITKVAKGTGTNVDDTKILSGCTYTDAAGNQRKGVICEKDSKLCFETGLECVLSGTTGGVTAATLGSSLIQTRKKTKEWVQSSFGTTNSLTAQDKEIIKAAYELSEYIHQISSQITTNLSKTLQEATKTLKAKDKSITDLETKTKTLEQKVLDEKTAKQAEETAKQAEKKAKQEALDKLAAAEGKVVTLEAANRTKDTKISDLMLASSKLSAEISANGINASTVQSIQQQAVDLKTQVGDMTAIIQKVLQLMATK